MVDYWPNQGCHLRERTVVFIKIKKHFEADCQILGIKMLWYTAKMLATQMANNSAV